MELLTNSQLAVQTSSVNWFALSLFVGFFVVLFAGSALCFRQDRKAA